MNKSLATAAGILLLGVSALAAADTLFTTPVIFLTPPVLNFGLVYTNSTATNTIVVENMGVGKLVGKATVPEPFKIVDGGDYSLRAHEAQIVTITYKPSGAALDKQTVTFTGGGGAKASVTGKPSLKPPKKFRRELREPRASD